ALKIYAAKLHPEVHAAHALAAKIDSGHIKDGMTLRDVVRSQWSGLREIEAIRRGFGELDRCNWAYIEKPEASFGRPSEIIRLNPMLSRGVNHDVSIEMDEE